jgi:hypothetical protein
MKKSLFEYLDYKQYLKALFQQPENRGLMSDAAVALECSKSYLSRVLNEKMDLSLDQAFRLSQFLGHRPAERDYFSLCIEFARAQSREYRAHLRGRIAAEKEKYELSQRQGQKPVFDLSESELNYFAQWHLVPLHLMTSFPGGISIQQACENLRLNEDIIKTGFDYLVKRNLVVAKGLKYHFQSGSKYLPPSHPLLGYLYRSVRDQAWFHSQMQRSNAIHFSLWQTLSVEDYSRVHETLLNAIEKMNRISQPSRSEKVVGIAIDFFDPFTQSR